MPFLKIHNVSNMGQNVGFWHYELKNHHVFIKIYRKMKFISMILYYICTI